jgi:hypothetical protein
VEVFKMSPQDQQPLEEEKPQGSQKKSPSQGADLSWLEDVTGKPGYPKAFGITGMSMPKKQREGSDRQSTDRPEKNERDTEKECQD